MMEAKLNTDYLKHNSNLYEIIHRSGERMYQNLIDDTPVLIINYDFVNAPENPESISEFMIVRYELVPYLVDDGLEEYEEPITEPGTDIDGNEILILKNIIKTRPKYRMEFKIEERILGEYTGLIFIRQDGNTIHFAQSENPDIGEEIANAEAVKIESDRVRIQMMIDYIDNQPTPMAARTRFDPRQALRSKLIEELENM